jgi:uncharacterized membrane protein/glycosyltransferase involved in cell wall biosynthesis
MIFHVSSVYPPKLGGIEKVVQALSRTQKKLGKEVSVLTSDQGINDGKFAKESFTVSRLKSFSFANTTIIPSLPSRLLRLKRDDIAHVHLAQAYVPEVVWAISKLKGFSYIAHIHLDVPPSGPAGFLLKLYKPLVLKRVLHAAKFTVVFTEEQKGEVVQRYSLDPAKVKVVPNGVEDTFYYDKKRKIHKKPRLLFVGRLNYQKNLQQLLHALDGVSDQFETTIVGDGELKPELKHLAKDLKLKNVSFPGRKDGKKLLAHYHKADIFVLPSEREGMPLVLLEAMAMGLPIVATDVTGSRDVVSNGKNGFLVPHGDADEFRNALLRLKTKPKLYESMSKSGRKIANQYSWDKVASQFDSLYAKKVTTSQSDDNRSDASGNSVDNRIQTKSRYFLWQAILPLLVLANAAYFAKDILGWIITLGFFLFVPGYLALNRIKHGMKSNWEIASFSLGLSLLIIMAGGLSLNSLHAIGLGQPLTSPYIFAMLDLVTVVLIAVNRAAQISVPRIRLRTNIEQIVCASILTFLPLLAIGGAIRLNNGASNILTMLLFALIAGLFMILVWRKELEVLYPYGIFTIALSILFSTSLRGWSITGHDIVHEFEVFQATSNTGLWHTLTPYRDPYSACLSITILPTIMAKITSISDAYIYKVVFQMIFAFSVVPIYLLTRKLSNSRSALIGALLFISFPPFLNDMPFLNRQEIAFLFFGLLLLVNFMEITYTQKFLLSCAFVVGIVFSHYSSSYVTLGLLSFAWAFYQLITHRSKDSRAFSLPILSLPFIIGSILLTLSWNAIVTQTSPGVEHTIHKAIETIEHRNFTQANGVGYSLFSFSTQNPTKILNNYAGKTANEVKYIPEANLPRTEVGNVISHVVPVETINNLVRSSSAKILQLLLLIGTFLLFVKRRHDRNTSQRDTYFLALTAACLALLVLMVLVPQLSVAYSVTRLFQQTLIIIALPIVLAAQTLFSKAGQYKTYVVAGFFAILFLHLSGFIPQLLGGYPPQMALNNAGTYYDIYYVHKGETLSADWIDVKAQVSTAKVDVDADEYGKTRFLNYPFQKEYIVNPVVADEYKTEYLYQDYVNVHRGVYAAFLDGDVLEYTFNDQTGSRNLVYVNQSSRIYGKIDSE